MREQISREWIDDLALVAAENDELARHREDSMFLDVETAEKDRKMVFDHGEMLREILVVVALFSRQLRKRNGLSHGEEGDDA